MRGLTVLLTLFALLTGLGITPLGLATYKECSGEVYVLCQGSNHCNVEGSCDSQYCIVFVAALGYHGASCEPLGAAEHAKEIVCSIACIPIALLP